MTCAYCEVPIERRDRKHRAYYSTIDGKKITEYSIEFKVCSLCDTLANMNRWEREHQGKTVVIRHTAKKALEGGL